MKLTDFKALTFDVYGTLIDWETGIVNALQPLVSKVSNKGKQILSHDDILQAHAKYESSQQAFTPTRRYQELLPIVYRRLAEQWQVSVTWDECLVYGQSVKNWPAFDDSAESLRYLKQHYKLIVLTNTDNDSFKHSQDKLGIEFDGCYTAEDAGSYKPNQRNFEYMLEQLKSLDIRPSDILHTAESMFHDHEPANKIGLTCCHIYRRHQQSGFGATMKPDVMPNYQFRFNNMADLVTAHQQETNNE